MKLVRYWLPGVLGFTIGSLLSLKMSGTPMRDLLASARAEASGAPIIADGNSIRANTPLEESDRFVRFFSAMQEVRALKRRSDLHSAIGDLGAGDLEPLINRIESLRWKVNTNDLVDVILQRWFEIDRAAAKAWIRSRPDIKSYQVLLAKTEPETALQEIGQNPHLPWAEEIIHASVETLAGGVETEKARLILQLPDSFARNRALSKITSDLAAREPSQALTIAQSIPEAALRSAATTNALNQWIRKDVEGAAKEISARLSVIENSRGFGGLVANTVSNLARKDVNQAIEWIGSLPEHQRSDGAYASVASVWAGSQPTEALQWCAAHGIDASSSFPTTGNGSVITAAMQSNPVETLRWIQSQPAGATRDALLERALVIRAPYSGLLSNSQSEDLLQELQALPDESRARAAAGIGKLVAGGGPQSTPRLSVWLERLLDPALRAATIVGAAEANAYESREPTKDFSNQFAEGPDRDAALRGLVNIYKNYDGERLAADTALRISDQTLQLKTLDTFIVDWLRKDPTAATQWLKTAPSIPPHQSAAWEQEANATY